MFKFKTKLNRIIVGIFAFLFLLPLSSFALSTYKSIQVGSSPSNGDVLQTNGTDSVWVATSTLGISTGGGGDNNWHISGGSLTPTTSIPVLLNSLAAPSDSQFKIKANGLGGLSLLNYGAGDQEVLFDTDWTGTNYVATNGVVSSIRATNDGLDFFDNSGQSVGVSADLGSSRMRVTPSGDVGINQTTPLARLHITPKATIVTTVTAASGLTLGFSTNPSGHANDGSSVSFTIYAYSASVSPTIYEATGVSNTGGYPSDADFSQVDLAWTASPDATGYIVYNSTTNQYLDVGAALSATFIDGSGWSTGPPTLSPTSHSQYFKTLVVDGAFEDHNGVSYQTPSSVSTGFLHADNAGVETWSGISGSDITSMTPNLVVWGSSGGGLAQDAGFSYDGSDARIRVGFGITPTADNSTSGTVNNYSASSVSAVRLSNNVTFTGIASSPNYAGKFIYVSSAAGTTLTYKNENTGSIAGNRFTNPTSADVVQGENSTSLLVYNGPTNRWEFITVGKPDIALLANNFLETQTFSKQIQIPSYAATSSVATSTSAGKTSLASTTLDNRSLLNFGSSTTFALSENRFSGFWGMGTTSPSRFFTVSGNFYLTSGFYDETNSKGTPGQILMSTNTGTQWTSTSTMLASLPRVTSYNGTSTTDILFNWGSQHVTGKTAAFTFNTYQPTATTTVQINGYANVTSIATDVLQPQCTFTDETGTSRTVSLTIAGASASIISGGITAAGYYTIVPFVARIKANTSLSCTTALTTSIGSITYDAGLVPVALESVN